MKNRAYSNKEYFFNIFVNIFFVCLQFNMVNNGEITGKILFIVILEEVFW